MADSENSKNPPAGGNLSGPPAGPSASASGAAVPDGATPLGVYFIAMAIGLSFLVYVLWPDSYAGQDGVARWEDTVRVFSFTLGSESRLILLVLAAGALGSYVHAATSFVTYVGNRTLRLSWVWWYVLRPFIGMALALIFYFVVRGGLLSAGADANEVSPFGITAVAGLVGMFSKQATDKLEEVFDNLFRTQHGGDEQRRDKATGSMGVTEKMIPINKITAIQLKEGEALASVKILDLYSKYGGLVTRLPVLQPNGSTQHVIHQSLVYKFISEQSVGSATAHPGQAFDPAALTLAKLLEEPKMKELAQAVAYVSETATVGEAKAAMDKVTHCQDVFVTANGGRDGAVKGWLTNIDIGRLADA